MSVVLGLLVALTYGTGDFLGGLSAKRTPAATVVIGSFAVAAVLVGAITVVWALVGGLPHLGARDLWLSVAAGCVGPVALGFFYQGLAAGRMSVFAPITAIVAAIVPFTWGVLHGERPAAVAVAGALLAIASVGLISGAPARPSDSRPDEVCAPKPPGPDLAAHTSDPQTEVCAPKLPGPDLATHTSASPAGPPVLMGALLAGLGFGLIFVLLGSTTDDAGLWPLLVGRIVSLILTTGALAALAAGRPAQAMPSASAPALASARPTTKFLPAHGSWRLVAGAGTFDVVANGLYVSAAHRGLLSIVAVLSSLYPASTVVLARVVLGERLHAMQLVGLAVAALGVLAMTAG